MLFLDDSLLLWVLEREISGTASYQVQSILKQMCIRELVRPKVFSNCLWL